MTCADHDILYHYQSSVGIGELERYIITYDLYIGEEIPADLTLDSLWLKVKNMENMTFRAAYLMGPYVLYCDIRTEGYHHKQRLFVSADQPRFESNIQPQQDFIAELSLHNLKKRYVWVVDVASQIIFTRNTAINFGLTVAGSKDALNRDYSGNPNLGSQSSRLRVTRLNTADLWNAPLIQISHHEDRNEHLVILTHGLHSNVTADLFYLKEQIETMQKCHPELLLVRGFTENVCKTEKGIKWLGTRLAEYIVKQLYNEKVVKISFVGHSLGGLVQAFAIAYISYTYPWFFSKVKPVNFITLASPLVGIVSDNAVYIQRLLAMGIVGKTGQDLSLNTYGDLKEPLLLTMTKSSALKRILKCFDRRTVYGNATNDGIVPLYTSGLLFIDYDAILENLDVNECQEIEQDIFKKTFISPLTKAMSILAPQRVSQNGSKLPLTSVLDSAYSVLVPPLPDMAYIMDPRCRNNVIVHDRVYNEHEWENFRIKDRNGSTSEDNVFLKMFNVAFEGEFRGVEEDIARQWHQNLSWRKVIVNLKPDAHNNIIVRRRFTNAYGWTIVDHLVQAHFSSSPKTQKEWKLDPIDLTEDYSWLTEPNVETVFDVGPTGMISAFGEIFDSIKNSTFQEVLESANNQSGQEELFKYDGHLGGDEVLP